MGGRYELAQEKYRQAHEQRQQVARSLIQNRHSGTSSPFGANPSAGPQQLQAANQAVEDARQEGIQLLREVNPENEYNDTNYIFLNFVTNYFPMGVVGLIIAAIFAAAMSSISSELNSLSTTTVIDLYRRHWKRQAPDAHYVRVAKIGTAFWGVYAAVFASFVGGIGSLIEAVNSIGSLFYGSVLGVFVLAFGFPRATGNGAFIGLFVGEIAVIATSVFTDVSFLWYNVIGCVVVVGVGMAVSGMGNRNRG